MSTAVRGRKKRLYGRLTHLCASHTAGRRTPENGCSPPILALFCCNKQKKSRFRLLVFIVIRYAGSISP